MQKHIILLEVKSATQCYFYYKQTRITHKPLNAGKRQGLVRNLKKYVKSSVRQIIHSLLLFYFKESFKCS